MFDNQRGRCFYCSGFMKLRQGFKNSATIEHCHPKSQGGTLSYFNTMLVCRDCNQARGNGVAPKEHPWDRERQVWRDVLSI